MELISIKIYSMSYQRKKAELGKKVSARSLRELKRVNAVGRVSVSYKK